MANSNLHTCEKAAPGWHRTSSADCGRFVLLQPMATIEKTDGETMYKLDQKVLDAASVCGMIQMDLGSKVYNSQSLRLSMLLNFPTCTKCNGRYSG